jgi:glycosyltransferase involved in cell wall biosynthesis
MAVVDILLSTYNGAEYLQVLLDSLVSQEFSDWRILVRDDGSKDKTQTILNEFSAAYPGKMLQIAGGAENLGPTGSFACLLEHSVAEYVMFCDQDDVWLPGKIRLTYEKMCELTAAHGWDMPLLVHSDLVVVDEKLAPMADSFWAFAGLKQANGGGLNHQLVMNVITGCTIMINRAAKECVLPIPVEAIMHDWWCALVVAGLGKTAYVPVPLILYRQHQANTLGAQRYSVITQFKKMLDMLKNWSVIRNKYDLRLCRHYRQALAFERIFSGRLSREKGQTIKGCLRAYLSLPLLRLYWVWRYKLWRSGLLRNLVFVFYYIKPATLRGMNKPCAKDNDC